MKETKRLYLALLVLAAGFFWCMCAGLFWPAQAEEDSDKGAWAASPLDTVKFSNLSDEDFQFNSKSQLYYAKAFSTLSDAEYSDVIGNLVMSTDDYVMLAERLEKCGIKVGCIKRIYPDETAPTTANIKANVGIDDITIIATATQRTGSTNWRVGAAIMFAHKESGPDTLDAATIYFDSTKANYVGYEVGYTGAITLSSGRYATQGTLAFNYNDQKMVPGTVYTAMAVIKPTAAAGTRIDFGMDYVHSYSTISVVPSSFPIGMDFGGRGLVGGSIGVNFDVTKCEHTISIADTGSFKI